MNSAIPSELRDKKLRKRILAVLFLARAHAPKEGLGGQAIWDLLVNEGGDYQVEGEFHAARLLADLELEGLISQKRLERHKGEVFSLNHKFFTITAKGRALHMEEIDPIPSVYDERIGDERVG